MTLDAESRLALAEDELAVATFLASTGGGVTADRDDESVRWISMHPRTAPAETYVARLYWTSYPHVEPSVTFATGVRGEIGVLSAWPRIPGYRAPNDICMPFTAEGYGLHPEWRIGRDAWVTLGNPYLRVVVQLQDDLDNRYQGRAA